MSDKWPLANGVYSNAANWNGGTLPVDGDIIYLDNRTVTLDQDIILPNAEIRTTARSGGTAGGVLSWASGSYTIEIARSLAGSTTPITMTTAGTTTYVGVTFEGSATSSGVGMYNNGGGSTSHFVNCIATGGVGGSGCLIGGVSATASGTLSLIQTVTSSANAFQCNGITFLDLTGSVVHGKSGVTFTCAAQTTGTYTIISETAVGTTCNGGTKWSIGGTSTSLTIIRQSPSLFVLPNGFPSNFISVTGVNTTVEYQGDLQQHNGGPVLYISGTGTVIRHRGILYGPDSYPSNLAVYTAAVTAKIVLERIGRNGTSGLMPQLGNNWCLRSDSEIVATTEAGTVTLVPSDSVGDPPSQTDVRDGVAYHFDTMEGSLVVPLPAHVSIGVATDNTVGTLVAAMTASELRAAVGLEIADLDFQLTEILAAAGSGGGGAGGLTSEQNAILNLILASVAQITGARLEVAGAVTPAGRIRLIRGKDYTLAGSSLIARSVADVGGVLAARLNADGTTRQFGARLPGTPSQTIAGTIASVVYASDVTVISIEIPAANLPLTLSISDGYIYQIQRTTAGQKVPELSGALSLELEAV